MKTIYIATMYRKHSNQIGMVITAFTEAELKRRIKLTMSVMKHLDPDRVDAVRAPFIEHPLAGDAKWYVVIAAALGYAFGLFMG